MKSGGENMDAKHAESVVYANTEDGLQHAGVLFEPVGVPEKSIALLISHGIGGICLNPEYVVTARLLSQAGYRCVAGNNRGHEFGWGPVMFANGEERMQGSGWELFSESPLDLDAWIDFLAGQGASRIVLFGHSFGAFKSVYYQSLRNDPRVVGIALGSPPTGVARLARPEVVAQCEQLVAAGRGKDLLPGRPIPFGPGTMTAEAALDLARLNIDLFGVLTPDPAVSRIGVPILVWYGSEEPNVGDESSLALIKSKATASPRVETHFLPGVDHSYRGHQEQIAGILLPWLETLG
jgi:pimeloyl-ACP methyl ester carboxylesterase